MYMYTRSTCGISTNNLRENVNELRRFSLLLVYMPPGTAFVGAKSQVSTF